MRDFLLELVLLYLRSDLFIKLIIDKRLKNMDKEIFFFKKGRVLFNIDFD